MVVTPALTLAEVMATSLLPSIMCTHLAASAVVENVTKTQAQQLGLVVG